METASRTHRFLSADLYTAGYRVVGKISVSAGGLYATVNDPTKSHIEVHDARLARIHMPTKLVDRFEAIRLIKTHIHALCAARREDLGPAAIVRGGYTNVASLPVRLTSSVYETEGKLEVMGRFDFAALAADATRNFIPLFDCLLTAILIPNLKMESPAVLFNWEHIDMMASLNQRVKEEK